MNLEPVIQREMSERENQINGCGGLENGTGEPMDRGRNSYTTVEDGHNGVRRGWD